jgi:hypothetical protein
VPRQRINIQPPPPAAPPPVIDPRQVFSLPQAGQTLGLAKNCLPREVRLGRLKVARRGGRYYVLGAWLLAWLEAGVVRPRRRQDAPPEAAEVVAG